MSLHRLSAIGLLCGLFVVPAHTSHGQQAAAQWIETLRLTIEAQPEETTAFGRSAIAELPFEPGSTTPTPSAVQALDALAAALASRDLHRSFFEIAWFADPNQKTTDLGQALAPRRAAALYEHLQAKPGITPWRIMLRQARKRPEGVPEITGPNSLTIIVTNLGR